MVGGYRPPGEKRPSYEISLGRILQDSRKRNVATTIAGDFNRTAWDKGYADWLYQEAGAQIRNGG